MNQASNPREPAPRLLRPIIGFVLALPLALLQAWYISNVTGWEDLFSYGGFFVILPVTLLLWLAFLIAECVIRRNIESAAARLPWFAFVAFVFLLLFFVAGPIFRPLVLKVPAWCRVYQITEIPTTRPDNRYGGDHSFALVLTGRGNRTDHRFTGGYLNWTGEESAGYTFDLDEQTFSHWVAYDQISTPASKQVLCQRISNAGLDPDETEQICAGIWQVMQQATAGNPVMPSLGNTGPVEEAPFGHEDIALGGVVWIVLLLGAFLTTAQLSLPKQGNTEPV